MWSTEYFWFYSPANVRPYRVSFLLTAFSACANISETKKQWKGARILKNVFSEFHLVCAEFVDNGFVSQEVDVLWRSTRFCSEDRLCLLSSCVEVRCGWTPFKMHRRAGENKSKWLELRATNLCSVVALQSPIYTKNWNISGPRFTAHLKQIRSVCLGLYCSIGLVIVLQVILGIPLTENPFQR